MDTAEMGRKGEAAAAKVYIQKGYQLQAHNYKCRMGELDLVLRKDNTVVICEVKTRSERTPFLPREAVDIRKQNRILLATKRYLQQTHQSDLIVRFDVAEVLHTKEHQFHVHIIQNAFECE